MPKIAHTPGPWKVGRKSKTTGVTIWRGLAETNDWAQLCRNVRSPEDAQVIAAAPDTYAACYELVHGGGTPESLKRALALATKALIPKTTD